jgi:hypothetical protein
MANNHRKLLAAGSAALVVEPALALMHTGGVGVIVGLGVAAAAYMLADDLEGVMGKDSPSLPVSAKGKQGTSSLAYRLLNGKSTRGQELADQTEEEEVKVAPRNLALTVHLADNLIIPASDLAGKAVFIAGIRRSGKTTLGVRLAEQMSKFDLPLFVPDLEGDWLSAAATTFKRGRVFAHPSAARKYTDVKDFEAVTLEDADVAGFNILVDGAQAVLDMASYPSVDEACAVVCKIIQGLFDWTEQYEEDRVPCQVYLDEAQRFLPQNLEESIIQDKLVRNCLLKAYMDIIAVGGKRGLNPVVLTQRFAQVNKKIMAQSEVFFLLRQTNERDLARCMEYVSRKIADEEAISALKQGQGVYIAATGEQGVYQYSPRESDGKRGATPTVEAAARYSQAVPRIRKTAAQAITEEIPTTPTLPADLQKALDAYEPGMSYREMGEAIGTGKDRAGELIKELKKRGLVEQE